MHVGPERRRFTERAHPHETDILAASISTPQRSAAFCAAVNHMRLATVGRLRIGGRFARAKFNPAGLDNRVQHKGASGLALAIPAVTTMHEHRRRSEPVFDGPA